MPSETTGRDAEVRRLTPDVLIAAIERAETILDQVQGAPVASAVGSLVNELHDAWREFDRLGGFDGRQPPTSAGGAS